MIQRIQTVYYAAAMILLLVPMLGMDIFTEETPKVLHHITLFGNNAKLLTPDAIQLPLPQVPLFWGNLIVVVLLLIVTLSYKNLKRQAILARYTLIAYAFLILGMCVMGFVFSGLLIGYQAPIVPETGLYCIVLGIVFVLLGNRGVRKDRKLLDSLNRLR